MISFNLKEEMWINGRYLIPGHLNICDYLFILKHNIRCLWYRYVGKYKIVDSTKYIKTPVRYFVLSKKQIDKVNKYGSENGGVKNYIFTPLSIGTEVYVEYVNGIIEDITDYDIW